MKEQDRIKKRVEELIFVLKLIDLLEQIEQEDHWRMLPGESRESFILSTSYIPFSKS